ncbi:ester cyclase [Amycolatopsis sp. GM8]|uniref:ester cyclase n=1 Tax=Amycolatopsis sp. GM8 TaxID=2896530 RepID=UPI001F2957DB|nr:ester cyclase [Amycolatopsis sp. GM8]
MLPHGRFELLDGLVTPGCVTHRAGFADLVAARGGVIPSDGSFRERVEAGWLPMSRVLRDQQVAIDEISGAGDTVWMRSRVSFTHAGEFLGAPATNRRIEFREVGLLRFGDDRKIADVWFLCEELNAARQLGFALQAPTSH